MQRVARIKLRKQTLLPRLCRVVARLMLCVDYRKADFSVGLASAISCLFLKVRPQHIATSTSSQSLEDQ